MDFLRSCARRLDDGEAGDAVLAAMRERYTTPQCLSSKASLVRGLCQTDEGRRRLSLPRDEMKACKRAGARAALQKNKTMRRVDARALLRCARDVLDRPDRAALEELVLSLIVLSGRRMVEVLAAGSLTEVRPVAPHTLRFEGQAKTKRARPYQIPVLHRAEAVEAAFREVARRVPRRDATPELSERQVLSRAYQSWLGRALAKHPVLRQAGRVHALRAVYACMCARLFEWDDDYSPAYVAMRVLGHASLGESLVYTPYMLGADFEQEPTLGRQTLADVCNEEAEA